MNNWKMIKIKQSIQWGLNECKLLVNEAEMVLTVVRRRHTYTDRVPLSQTFIFYIS